MVVDSSEEIAGGGDIPHSCIGSARRMLGTAHQSKYEVLEEAMANHGPEVRPVVPCLYVHGCLQSTALQSTALQSTAMQRIASNLFKHCCSSLCLHA